MLYPLPPPLLCPGARTRLRCLAAVLALVAVVCPLPSGAQTVSGTAPAGATLRGWYEDVFLALRDQRHAYGGLFFDRGVLRPFTPSMDHEYLLDVTTFAYTPADDAVFYAGHHGFRSYLGSIDRSHFATRNHFRNEVAIGRRHAVSLNGVQQEDLQAERFFVGIGYSYQLGDRHRLGAEQTVASYKPDLDFDLFYGYRHPSGTDLRLGLTLLDAANDLIFDVIGVDPVLEDTIRSYDRAPRLFSVRLQTPGWAGWRAELFSGVQPRARALVTRHSDPEYRFLWESRFAYTGLLVEFARPRFQVGATYRYTTGAAARRAAAPSRLRSDYESAQATSAVTAYALGRWNGWRGELWLTRRHFRDRQDGTNYEAALLPFGLELREWQTGVHARMRHQPARRGPRFGIAYAALDRTFPSGYETLARYLRFLQSRFNHRVSLITGLQLSPAAFIELGASYDLDGDPFYDGPPRRFDGGYGRVVVLW